MEENKTKVWAVKEVRVEYYKAQPAENGDEYPYYATKITTYRVFVSNDITLDMPIAQKAIKEIIGNVTSETIKLTLDIRSIDDGDRFSKEMTQQATELLSAVLPQYHFEAAESGLGFAGLKYEIEAQNNVVAKRRKVVKYILVALFITAIIRQYTGAPVNMRPEPPAEGYGAPPFETKKSFMSPLPEIFIIKFFIFQFSVSHCFTQVFHGQ